MPQGPSVGGTLFPCAAIARLLSQTRRLPILAVNYCVGHIEMPRPVTGARNLLVLHVSDGNSQVLSLPHFEQFFAPDLVIWLPSAMSLPLHSSNLKSQLDHKITSAFLNLRHNVPRSSRSSQHYWGLCFVESRTLLIGPSTLLKLFSCMTIYQ